MKNQNIVFTLLLIIISLTMATAQEYKLNLTSGTLKFKDVHRLTIEQAPGNEVIFTSTGGNNIPERAEGLKPVNSQGLQDNTGVGLSLTKEGENSYLVTDVLKNSGRYNIKVPKGVKIMVEQNSVHSEKVEIINISNDLELSTRYNEVHLENISGSALINTVHGGVNAEFSQLTPGKPVSIISAHGYIDVTFPSTIKADVFLSSKYGDIFTNMDIKYDTSDNQMRQVTSTVNGKINGGGTEVFLESAHNNIFLRKR